MKTILREAIVPYSPQQMFDLVNDIARYPEFIPHCTTAHIIKAASSSMEAKLAFRKGILQQSFTTCNTLIAPKQILMQLVDGPFQSLEGAWIFKALPDNGCQVGLKLQFSFKNALLDLSLGAFFQQIGSQLVDAFSQRAKVIYGI